jgi:hypothetical protein
MTEFRCHACCNWYRGTRYVESTYRLGYTTTTSLCLACYRARNWVEPLPVQWAVVWDDAWNAHAGWTLHVRGRYAGGVSHRFTTDVRERVEVHADMYSAARWLIKEVAP